MGGNVKQIDGPSAGAKYPSTNECNQAILAANYAKTNGTLIYSISYGSETTGSRPTARRAQALRYDAGHVLVASVAVFLLRSMNDPSNPTETTVCANAVPLTALNQVFTTIASQLTVARLVPAGDF